LSAGIGVKSGVQELLAEEQKFKPKSSPQRKGKIGRTEDTEDTEEIKKGHLVEGYGRRAMGMSSSKLSRSKSTSDRILYCKETDALNPEKPLSIL
jgi:hypothetical protein